MPFHYSWIALPGLLMPNALKMKKTVYLHIEKQKNPSTPIPQNETAPYNLFDNFNKPDGHR
jgi:hypothetical protein